MLNYDLHWNPVRLIQRFGRIDRIGTKHEVINLHNMWPDVAVDAELSLTNRLHRRIQSFHDLIGLDSKLLSDAERLNAKAMYRIYEGKKLPEIDDGLDEVAANQRAITLLQRNRGRRPGTMADDHCVAGRDTLRASDRDRRNGRGQREIRAERNAGRGLASSTDVAYGIGVDTLSIRRPAAGRDAGAIGRRECQGLLCGRQRPAAAADQSGSAHRSGRVPPRHSSPAATL